MACRNRLKNVYLFENISGDGHETQGTNREAVLFQIKKYFDSYQWIKGKEKTIDSANEIDRFIVCVSNLSGWGQVLKQIAPEEAILANSGIDDVLSTKLMVFKDIGRIQKRLLPSIKDSYVEKHQSSTHLVPGKELLNDTKVSEVIAFYLLTLITMNLESKSIKIDASHPCPNKLVSMLSRCCQSNMSGSYSFRREFLDGASVNSDIETFRNTLKLGLHAMGHKLPALGDYTFHFHDHFLNAGGMSKIEFQSFLEKLRFCQQPVVTAESNDSFKNEMKKCLKITTISTAKRKFIELVAGLIAESIPITDKVVVGILDEIIRMQHLMEISVSVDPEIDYRPIEGDIIEKCFCDHNNMCFRGFKDCCSTDGPRGCFTESIEKQLAREIRLHYHNVHQGLVMNLGSKHLKTREIRMKLAYNATLEGLHQMAFDLTEGECDQDGNPTAHTISKGFQHVRGRALIGLGRYNESVEYLVSSCIYRTRGTLSIKRPAFRATINIIHELVCQGKVKFAGNFVLKVLDNILKEEGPLAQRASFKDGSPQDGGRNQFEFLNECVRQLAFAVHFQFFSPDNTDLNGKDVLNLLKCVHHFFVNRLGVEHLVTLEMKYVFAKVYSRVVKTIDKKRKAVDYLLEVHESLYQIICGRDDYSRHHSHYVQSWQCCVNLEILSIAGIFPAMMLLKNSMLFAISIHDHHYLEVLQQYNIILRSFSNIDF
ncbi:uncharacterized protein [Hetaerina americana]|uniref:uncharacterized protein n=1 Tax=Hetaerina americana TaxID=62018 RepID=UPI003A7F3A01